MWVEGMVRLGKVRGRKKGREGKTRGVRVG